MEAGHEIGATCLFREHDVVRTPGDVIEKGQVIPAASRIGTRSSSLNHTLVSLP